MKLSTFVFVFSTLVLAVAALPIQDAVETTVAAVADSNDDVPTEVSIVARQEEGPTEATNEVAEEDEEDEEDSPTERATTLRTAPAPAPVPSRPKVPSTSFAQEWAIVTGNVAPSDIALKTQPNEAEKEIITSS
ncbi:unnamed protein product [Allacma fusca]|uniref:Uncharacterized protein n=1 Tax=Allacma fusca TaxID=39272 RepID=A0A8J2PAK8_9HEXA|nr:unnamed protein product [Allacma fusca]